MLNFLFRPSWRKACPECGECEFYSSFPASGWVPCLRLGALPPAANAYLEALPPGKTTIACT